MFLPGVTLEKARVVLQMVYGAVAAPYVLGSVEASPEVHAPSAPGTLLTTADLALRTAQSTSTGGTHL